MLVLTRKQDEKILAKLGNEIVEFTILNISKNKVTVGISAPSNVSILRPEMVSSPQRNNSLIDPVPE